MKTYLTLLATIALAIPAHASLTGASVTTSYVVPPGTIFQSGEFYAQTAEIGTGQEFVNFGFAKNVQIDFTEDKVLLPIQELAGQSTMLEALPSGSLVRPPLQRCPS